MTGFRLRDSHEDDAAALARIYGHWVRRSLASFELEPPAADEMARRREAIVGANYPHLVATDADGGIAGFAYAGPYRSRPAYRYACENSVYVSPAACGRGVGKALLRTLITRCEASGLRLMVAVIGDSANAASIGLHRSLGFAHVGALPAVGWKQERWVDSVLMVRPLGPGAGAAPGELRIIPGPG